PVIEQTLSSFYETLEKRFTEINEADDIGLAPHELFLTGEELRENLDKNKRIELRALGISAAETNEDFTLATEDAEIQIGKNRTQSKPLFLFSTAEKPAEFEIQSRS